MLQNPPCGLQKEPYSRASSCPTRYAYYERTVLYTLSCRSGAVPLNLARDEVKFRVLPIGLLLPSGFRGRSRIRNLQYEKGSRCELVLVLVLDAAAAMTLTCIASLHRSRDRASFCDQKDRRQS
jgi:hypothetical protein